MTKVLKLSELSPLRQTLVRLCQQVNFGQVRDLRVQDADPVFDPKPAVLIDEKLDADDAPRPQGELPDFVLPAEICRLMIRLDQIGNGWIERIEVRAGIPRRVVFAPRLAEFFALEIKT